MTGLLILLPEIKGDHGEHCWILWNFSPNSKPSQGSRNWWVSPYINHQDISTHKLDWMVFRDDAGNRYWNCVDSCDLCNCQKVVGKSVGQTCQAKEGTRSCQPGSSLHDQSRDCILNRHADCRCCPAGPYSIHYGKMDLKSMTNNVEDAMFWC